MRGMRIAKIVIALVIVGIAYSEFKDDIAKLWQDLHVKLVERPTPKKTVWLDQGIAKDKAELVLSRRPGHADLRLSL